MGTTAIGSAALGDRELKGKNTRELTVVLSETHYAQLQRVAERSGAAPAVVAFAAFCALVYRYKDESPCSVGFNVSAGSKVELASIPGSDTVTTNMHVLNIDLSNDPSFETLLEESNASVRVGLTHSPAVTGARPFTLGFGTLDNTMRHRTFDDIWTVAVDDGSRLTLRWTHSAASERSTIERIATHFTHLLGGLIAEPGTPISRLPLMDDAERLTVLNLGRGKHIPYERSETIHALFSRQAQATPHRVAVATDHGTLSYAELEQRANRLSHHLRSLGVRPGTAVGVSLERSLALPVALLAILKAGAFYVPLDANYPRERLGFIVKDAGIAFIVTESTAPSANFGGVVVVDLNSDGAMIALQPTDAPVASDGAEALAYISYTSGSTGLPKGVAVMHRGVVRLVRGTDYIAVRSDDVFLGFAPIAFDASTFELWAPLLNGAQVAIPGPGLLSMPELGDTIAKFGVSVLFLTTSLFQKLVDSHPRTLGTLRLLLTGGEVASPRHMLQFQEALPSCALMAVYGPTENTTYSTWCELSNAAAVGRSVPIGRPIANSSAYVLDRHGEPVPIGAAGELWVGGDGVAQGYVNLPELTQERFVRDPFSTEPSARLYRTGDRARFRDDGVLEFLGRNDDQVKIRGHRVELGEIESVLQAHPAVLDAAVVVAHDSGEKALVAFVLPIAAMGDGEQVLRAFLTAKLPAFMLPNRFEFVDRLPQHPSGKLDRITLARKASTLVQRVAPRQRAPEPIRPRVAGNAAALQDAVAAIWREVLGGGRTPGADENFFDAGGDSLRLLTVHERLQREFSVSLRIVDLFEHSTVRKLAVLISRSQVRV